MRHHSRDCKTKKSDKSLLSFPQQHLSDVMACFDKLFYASVSSVLCGLGKKNTLTSLFQFYCREIRQCTINREYKDPDSCHVCRPTFDNEVEQQK